MPPLSLTFNDLIDITFLALLYFLIFFRKWRRAGKPALIIYTIMYTYLGCVCFFTLMPVITSLPFVFNHPYIPMHLEPFADLIYSHGGALRQIILNTIMTIPFGILLPLVSTVRGHKVSFFKTFFYTFLLSLSIELIQPLLSNTRSSDLTDLITNVIGGIIGYGIYLTFRPLFNKVLTRFQSPASSPRPEASSDSTKL